MSNFDYNQAWKYMCDLQKLGIKLGLEQTRELFKLAGNPEKKLKFIHLAGSNGKGSSGAMLNAALRRAGFKTGFYASPHMVSPRERFRINGEAISHEEFASLVTDLSVCTEKMSAEGHSPTFFEFTTAMAALCFARNNVDFVIWETGMGGRFDSTNVVTPVCSLITGIALDHHQFLGDTIEKIAVEKAGIIKPGRPVFTGKLQPEAMRVMQEKADAEASLLVELPKMTTSSLRYVQAESALMQVFEYDGHEIELSLSGSMQRDNFKLVYNVLKFLAEEFEFELTEALAGLSETVWPGRCQLIAGRILIDGAHNPNGINALLEALSELPIPNKIPVVFGSFKDKDTTECLKLLERVASEFVFLPIATDFRESWSGAELCEMSQKALPQIKAEDAANPAKALSLVEEYKHVLVCGSLYLAGEFLKELLPEHEILDI
ncbi:MAG: bifunctional folylpolyglutamate synthase/dihydrofolate synthase [Lentisphaerae bacterium]|nr:bifunctional folylpolyglutamate synthase/dihydrofolate synthase [Lentisphaerota bacterium]MCP4103560.1 bifunctional folylpolyglutamate synthase/dihydrofolate synthase [Lentisphaerota bacterium]